MTIYSLADDWARRLINLGWTPPADLLPILDVREG